MNIGKLNRRVTFVAQSTSQDTYGEHVNTWTPVCTVYANIKQMPLGQGRVLDDAEVIQTHVYTMVTVRYRGDIKATHQIQYAGRQLEILSLNNMGEGFRFIEVICREVV